MLKEAEELEAANQKLRDKIAANHRSAQNTAGVFASSLEQYFKCLPLINVAELKKLVDTEVDEWTHHLQKVTQA